MQEDRRRYPRVNIEWPVTLQTDQGSNNSVALNISGDGVFMRTWYSLEFYKVFGMEINGPDRIIKTMGELLWANWWDPIEQDIPRGMAVRFLNISDEDREFISALVSDQLKAERINRKEGGSDE